MKRPKKVVLNGFEWSITYKKMKKWKKEGHNLHCSGETYAATHSIFILVENISEDNVREVLQHEIMHASLAVSGGTYAVELAKKSNAEEVLISTLSATFLAGMLNNPEVREYLYGG